MGAIAAQQALEEPFEWGDFGTKPTSMRRFAEWLIAIEERQVRSIRVLRILHDEFCVHTGGKPLTERQLAQKVTKSPHIKRWRDRKANNAVRYRISKPKIRAV